MGSPIINGKALREDYTTLVTASDYSNLYPYLNAKGADKYLNTPFGQMEVFLDLDDDNDQYGVGTLDYVGQLINLDVNPDGILNSDDDFFDKLKLRGYNSNGEEVVLKLSDVYNSLDLTQFVHTQKDTKGDAVSGTSLFRPEESYKRLDDSQRVASKKCFKTTRMKMAG